MSSAFIDPVVAEIHAVRAAMLEAAGGDVGLLMRQVAERQGRSGHPVITQPFRQRTEPTDAAERGGRPELSDDGTLITGHPGG